MIDLKGQRYGRLVCGDRHPLDTRKVSVTCDCGVTKYVRVSHIRSGDQRSCGCLWKEMVQSGRSQMTHGLSGTKAHKIWENVVQRCTNPNSTAYKNYGGRGISLCERWMSFENFYADMGDRPAGMTLDRINNSGNYEPGNCRWATRVEQNRNARGNVVVDWFGKNVPAIVAYEESGSKKDISVVYKLLKKGRPLHEALWNTKKHRHHGTEALK